ncbi:MAG: methyltransferase [Chloroflexota bacterium]
MSNEKTTPSLWLGQRLHIACLIPLLILTWLVWTYLDSPFPVAFWVAVAIPIIHQIFVWLTWRTELRSQAISRTMGFQGYLIGFFLFFGSRFISLFILAWLDRGRLHLPTLLQVLITTIFVLLGVYAMYSVAHYFGMARAAGADHFDPRYREMPLVNEGIFRFTNNGMYIYAFLLFWAIALGFNSAAALTVAAFSHAYIWVHFYSTEKPDMDYLYG